MKPYFALAAAVYLLHLYHYSNSLENVSFDQGNFVANWTYDPETDNISVQVEVRARGYVSFGFAVNPPIHMENCDVVVGGVKDNVTYLNDFYTEREARPPSDTQQDYNLTNASEEDGKTRLTFQRKRDTGDPNDVQFKPGEGVYLVWAYHTSYDADDPKNFSQHSKSGRSNDTFVIVPGNPEATPKGNMTTAKPTDSAGTLDSGATAVSGALVGLGSAAALSLLYCNLYNP